MHLSLVIELHHPSSRHLFDTPLLGLAVEDEHTPQSLNKQLCLFIENLDIVSY